jgi:hypothetical protein
LKKGCRRAAGFSHVTSFAEHLRDDKNHHGAEEAAAAKEIDERIADCGDGQEKKGEVIHSSVDIALHASIGLWGLTLPGPDQRTAESRSDHPAQAGMPIEATRTNPLFKIEGKERRGESAALERRRAW